MINTGFTLFSGCPCDNHNIVMILHPDIRIIKTENRHLSLHIHFIKLLCIRSFLPMKDMEISEQKVDKGCQSFTAIVIVNIVDVVIRIYAMVNVVEGAVLQKGQALPAGNLEECPVGSGKRLHRAAAAT